VLAVRSAPLRAGRWLASAVTIFGVALAGYVASPTLAWVPAYLVAAGLAGAQKAVVGEWVTRPAQTVGPRVMQGGFGLLVATLGILLLTVLRRALANVGGPYAGEPYP
jgi:hypothetical protein